MSEAFERAKQCLAIKDIVLSKGNIFSDDEIDLENLDRDEVVVQNFRLTSKVKEYELVGENEKEYFQYDFFYSIGSRLIFEKDVEASSDKDFKPILEILAVFKARYRSEMQLEPDSIDEFSKENVGFHVWPYWREFLQSNCSRLNFSPPLEAPFYLLPQS